MNDVAHWGSDTPLVGRSDELDRLRQSIDRAVVGESSAVLLSGDAGVGKTRLLTEVIENAQAQGLTTLVGHCVDVGDVGLPYLPFSEILRAMSTHDSLATVLNDHPTAQRLLRTDSAADAAPDTSSRLQLFDAVTSLFADASAVVPLLVVIEDLHWADQSTRDLLRFVLSRLRSERLAFFASYRADDLHRRHPLRPLLAELIRIPAVDRLHLGPMPDNEVATLLRRLQRDSLTEPEVRRIVARAEGNAFYAEELLAAGYTGDLPGDHRGSDSTGGLPSGLTDVLLTRLEQLPPTAQRVVRLASVAGRRVGHELLRDAAGLPDDELDQALREAVSRHLLMSEDGLTYSFRHALLQEAAYGDLLPGERVRMHAVFAGLLVGSGEQLAAARAHHSRESHDLPGALSASLEAAAHAKRVGAPTEQLLHLEHALELWSAVEDAAERAGHSDVVLMLQASAAAAAAGDPTRAVALSRAALERVSPQVDAELAARVRYTLAKNLIAVDSDRAAYQQSSAALELIPADPPSLTRVWAAATHILTSFYADDLDGARRAADEALAGARALGAFDAQADVLISSVFFESEGRESAEGHKLLMKAYDLARRADNTPIELRAIFNLAIGNYEAGQVNEALRWSSIGLQRAAQTGLTWSGYAIELRHICVLSQYATGAWDEALASSNLSGVAVVEFAQHVAAAGLYVEVGRGVPTLERVDAILTDRKVQPLLAITAGSVGIDEAMWDADAEAAAQMYDRSTGIVRESWLPFFLAILRMSALCLGAIADRVAQEALAGNDEQSRHWIAEADRLIGEARAVRDARPEHEGFGIEAKAWLSRAEAEYARVSGVEPVAAWREALAMFTGRHVYEEARCKWRLAEAILTSSPISDDLRAEASGLAASAHDTARDLGAVPLQRAVEALIRRGRLDVGASIDTAVRTGAETTALTPREGEVLSLLARGHTNRQIGSTLYISAKTASVHVSNILAKLGAGSRAEAVAVAHRQGLIT